MGKTDQLSALSRIKSQLRNKFIDLEQAKSELNEDDFKKYGFIKEYEAIQGVANIGAFNKLVDKVAKGIQASSEPVAEKKQPVAEKKPVRQEDQIDAFGHIGEVPEVDNSKYDKYAIGGTTKTIKQDTASTSENLKGVLAYGFVVYAPEEDNLVRKCKHWTNHIPKADVKVITKVVSVDYLISLKGDKPLTVALSDYRSLAPDADLMSQLAAVRKLLKHGISVRFIHSEKLLEVGDLKNDERFMTCCLASLRHREAADEKAKKAELHEAVGVMKLRGRSKLDPHFDEIKKLLEGGLNKIGIIEQLRLDHGIKISRPSFYDWLNKNNLLQKD